MIRTVAKTHGLRESYEKMGNRLKAVSPQHLDAMAKAGAEFAAQKSIQEMAVTPFGRTHNFGKKVQRRPSSLPWHYPAMQEGDLVGSFDFKKLSTGVWAWDAGGPGVPQAFYMEFGTSKVAPRPYMRTTIVKYAAEIQRAMKAEQGRNMISTEMVDTVKAGGY